MCDFHKERVVRSAKKEHVCYLCGQKIEKGEQYRIMTGVCVRCMRSILVRSAIGTSSRRSGTRMRKIFSQK